MATSREERERVFAFRYAVYVEEMGKQPRGMDRERKLLHDALDDSAVILYVLGQREEIAATFRLNFGEDVLHHPDLEPAFSLKRFDAYPPSAFSFSSRLMVAPGHRGSAVLGQLLSFGYHLLRRRGVRFDFLHCRPSLVHFYEKLGHRRYRENLVDPDAGYQVPLVLLTEDLERMKRVGSPLLPLALEYPSSDETALWFEKDFGCRAPEVAPGTEGAGQILEFLEQSLHKSDISLFAGLSEGDILALLEHGTLLECRAGDVIIGEGEVGNDLFLLLSGEAEVMRLGDGGPVRVARIAQGQVFGEMAFLGQTRRTASVVARRDLEVLILGQSFFFKALQRNPAVGGQVLHNLALTLTERLVQTTRTLVTRLEEPASPLSRAVRSATSPDCR